jgi:Outer membrane receptor for ferrienterochelin and colicins
MVFIVFGYCEFNIKTVPNAYIKGESFSTYADRKGEAKLRGKEGEKVRISAAGYEPEEFVITCQDVEIYLKERPYKISEILVESYPVIMVERTKTVEHVRLDVQSPYSKPEEALSYVPGLSFEGKDVAGSVPAVRGLARFRTAVYLENFRVSTEREIGPSLFYAVPDVLDRAEVFKGGSTVFGSDAIGGSILYFLKGVASSNEVKLSYNSNNGLLGGYVGYKPAKKLYLGFGGYNANNYYFPDTIKGNGFYGTDMVQAKNSSYKKYSALLSAEYRGIKLSLVSFLARDLYRSYKSSSINYYPEINENFAIVQGNNVEFGFHNYTTLSRKVKGSDTTDNPRFGNDFFLRVFKDFWKFNLGFDYFGRWKVNSEVYKNGEFKYHELKNATSHEYGLFTLWNRKGENLEISSGARLGIYSNSGSKEIKIFPTGHLGAVYGFGKYYIRGNLIGSYRFPNFLETHAYSPRPRGFIEGNPNLKPEKGITFEGAFGSKTFEVLTFGIIVRDFIEMYEKGILDGDTVFSYENLNELAWIVGLEGKSNFNISRFYINSSLTLMKGGSGGKSISNIPPPRLYINFGYLGNFSPYFSLFYQARAIDVAEIEEEKPEFLILDLGVRYTLNKWSFNIGINNLNNAVAYKTLDPAQIPQPGRSLFINLRYSF